MASIDVVVSLTRLNVIGYHLAEAEAWLAASENGERTTLLSYAAFELRLEIERIAIELLGRIQRGFHRDDVRTMQSFGRLEQRIYELEGHQRILDKKIELSNIMLEAIRTSWRLQPINLGQLRRAWHDCSELCHIPWSLVVATPEAEQICCDAFKDLSEVKRFVRSIVDKGIAWPHVEDPSFAELRERFVADQAKKADVLAWIAERGLWARIVHPDGTARFEGRPVPPRAG